MLIDGEELWLLGSVRQNMARRGEVVAEKEEVEKEVRCGGGDSLWKKRLFVQEGHSNARLVSKTV